jgi:glycine/D-amino acid oxidase-like deaminating enzyme
VFVRPSQISAPIVRRPREVYFGSLMRRLPPIDVIGGGVAGAEAAWQIARRGVLMFGSDQRITSGPAATAAASRWRQAFRRKQAVCMAAPKRFAKRQIPLAPRAPSIRWARLQHYFQLHTDLPPAQFDEGFDAAWAKVLREFLRIEHGQR